MTIEPGAPIPPFVMDDITMDRIHTIMDLMHDTNPVHDDPELVERRKLRGPVNQGPANLSYILNMLHAWAGADMEVESFEFRFHEIVVPGDTVTASGTVTSVEDVERGRRVSCDVRLGHADGSTAVAGKARILIPTT